MSDVTAKLADALRRLVNTFPIPVDGVEQADRSSLRISLFTAREALRLYEQAKPAEPVADDDDMQALLEARAMLSEIGLTCREQTRFVGSYAEIVRQAFGALAKPAEPVEWQYKHVTETEWKRLVPRAGQSLEEALVEIQGYRYGNRRMYEVRALFAAPVAQAEPLPEGRIHTIAAQDFPSCWWSRCVDLVRAAEAAHGIKENQP
jgi:hypothetical protein